MTEIVPGQAYGFFTDTSVCIGCKACEVACKQWNMLAGNEPACAKACPTQSIQFGPLQELQQRADKRLADLHTQGVAEANLYGRDDVVYGGLNAFFLLMDKPEAYKLPNTANAVLPGRNNAGGYLTGLVTAVLGVLGGLIALRRRGQPPSQEPSPRAEADAP